MNDTPQYDTPATGGPVASPCINVCRMNERTGLCEGCWRRIDEIAAWSRMDDREKRAVWQLIEARRRHAANEEGSRE